MSDFRPPSGFEDVLRPPVDLRRARLTPAVLGRMRGAGYGEAAVRFERVARRVPEVMVKITGRTRDGAHLGAHLAYISRNGALALEGPDGERLDRAGVRNLADDWAAERAMERGRRRDAPASLSVVLSMPAGTDPGRLHDAARAFAGEAFGDRFPYVFALHDEGRHPHVHLTVRMLGRDGERLNPRKADLQLWRERFAHALRERSVEAEATPRRARGVTRKAERTPVRKLRERFEAGRGAAPRVLQDAVRDASEKDPSAAPWLAALRARRERIVRALSAEAVRLGLSAKSEDRRTAEKVVDFLKALPPVETRREAIQRRLEIPERKRRPPDDGRSR
ncbi:relaxase/mobilization nuclease domain-containing protein [Brevundimonas faecalis]|uniref:MobA/VirD2-like nuclease domain-containing protein n=1 Tax=Brevundimonas faecalis TaxID=947378 RepID=A0ABV2R7S2_9CAUL